MLGSTANNSASVSNLLAKKTLPVVLISKAEVLPLPKTVLRVSSSVTTFVNLNDVVE